MTNDTQRIKILFDATPMLVERTGIAYYTERLAVQLAQTFPDDVELVGFYYNFLGKRDSSHLPRLPNLRYTRATFIPSKIIYQLRRWGVEFPIELLAMQRADFILYPNFISYPSLFNTPSAPVIHDLTYKDLPDYVSPKLQRDLARFVPRDIKRASFTITVSEFTKKRIVDEYGAKPHNILVTPIPPVPPRVHSDTERKKLLKKARVSKPFILFVGTIEPRKNIINLIEAYKLLPATLRKKYSLVLAGRVERFAEAEARAIADAQKQGYDIIFPGYTSEEIKEALYQSASLLAHASKYEGFGMPILEAMSYGTPCIVSDIPIFREVAGNAARYFNEQDPTDVAKVLASVLADKKMLSSLARRAKTHVTSYSWENVATTLFERIKAALPKH